MDIKLSLLLCVTVWVYVCNVQSQHHLLFVPSELSAGGVSRVCVVGSRQWGGADLSLNLNCPKISTPILQIRERRPDVWNCFKFPVPDFPDTVCSVQILGTISNRKVNESKLVHIRGTSDFTIIQTDKSSYLPSQTVKFRILTLDSSFIPVKQQYPLIELKNGLGTVLARWEDVDGGRAGVVSLEFPLSKRPVLGRYTLIVRGRERGVKEKHTHNYFTVEEYVLPRFEVDFQTPERITQANSVIPLSVCAKYTFGRGVRGSVRLSVCRSHFYTRWVHRLFWKLRPPICLNVTSQTSSDGCFSSNVDTRGLFSDDPSLSSFMNVDMEFRENSTGELRKESRRIWISSQVTTLTLIDAPAFYKLGLPLELRAKLLDIDGLPSRGRELELKVISSNFSDVQRSTVSDRGIAIFNLNTEGWDRAAEISVRDVGVDRVGVWGYRVEYGTASITVSPAYSPSGSFLHVWGESEGATCTSVLNINVEFIINTKDKAATNFYYLGMSRGQIQFYGIKKITRPCNKGLFPLPLTLSPKMSPRLRILVFTLLAEGELVAGATHIDLPPCFPQQVSFGVSPSGGLPGSKVGFYLQSAPGAICGIRVVDKSVDLKDPGQQLTAEKVFNRLSFRDLTGHRYDLNDGETNPCLDQPGPSLRKAPFYYSHTDLGDTYNTFKELGLKMFSNIPVKRPILCYTQTKLRPVFHLAEFRKPSNVKIVDLGTQIRQYFPETWLWDLITVGPDGSIYFSAVVPDQITGWTGNSFCVSELGFGLSNIVEFVAFKEIFVRPSLPSVVVRGETFTLRATVFNYLNNCVEVGVQLTLGSAFEETCDSCLPQVCICPDNERTLQWQITARSIGQENITVSAEILNTKGSRCDLESRTQYKAKDIVIKPILNKAEGEEIETVTNIYVCVTATKMESGNFSLELPENHIPGSESASLSLTGNLIGSALDNLDQLLRLPTGCGEQNMLALGPNAYITRYLNQTKQLSDALRERAVKFLLEGYQNQLRYLRVDGSFSAFGSSDPSGSIWLTAFVLRVFSAVREFIFIDQELLLKSGSWIEVQQTRDGCFPNVGRVIHANMMGGVDEPVTLTAYITIALLELDLPGLAETTSKALDCLRAQHANVTQAYPLALLAYAFGLAHEASVVNSLRTRLYAKALREGGTVHWETEGEGGGGSAAQVEVTAYVLLQLLVGGEGGEIQAPPIIQWLVGQRNKRGGFQSTQDTVIALQAISLYEEQSPSGEAGDRRFTVGRGRLLRVMEVTEGTEVVRRELVLPVVPGSYWWTLEGQGCVYVQVSLLYNIPAVSKSHSFNLNVKLSCQGSNVFEILIETSYIGREGQSNMAILEVEMLSGYELTEESQKEIKNTADNVEFPMGFVILYFNQIGEKDLQVKLLVEEKDPVSNLEEKVIKVYDYYNPQDVAKFVYNTPCRKG